MLFEPKKLMTKTKFCLEIILFIWRFIKRFKSYSQSINSSNSSLYIIIINHWLLFVLILDRWILSLMKPNRLDLRQYKNFSLFLQNYEMFVCLKIESFLLSHSYKFTNYMGWQHHIWGWAFFTCPLDKFRLQ